MTRRLPLAPMAAALGLAAAACAPTPTIVRLEAPAPTTVFQQVAVFSGHGTQAVAAQDVWVVGETIAKVVSGGTEAPPPDAAVIDGRGKTLLPGLIDVHVHVEGTDRAPWDVAIPDPRLNVQRYLYAGLTTVFDLGGDLGTLQDLRGEVEAGELAGPDLRYAGPHVAVADGHPASMIDMYLPWPLDWWIAKRLSFQVEDEQDIDEAIAEIQAHDAHLVKITVDDIPVGAPHLTNGLLRHAVDRAHDAGYRVAAHIGTNEDAQAAVAAGADYLVHNVYREPLSTVTIAALIERGVAVAPTIGVFETFDRLMHEDREPPTDLMLALTPPDIWAALDDAPDDAIPNEAKPWGHEVHAARDVRYDNARALVAAGVPLLVGSDSPVSAWPAGAAFHRELDLLHRAGIDTATILHAATAGNAAAFGLDDRGTIAPGQRADLLLVDGDPLADLAAVHRIAAVYKAGRAVQRTPLAAAE